MKHPRPILLAYTAITISDFLLVYTFFFSRTLAAYVDSSKLQGGYKSMTEAREEFNKKQIAWKTNIDTRKIDI